VVRTPGAIVVAALTLALAPVAASSQPQPAPMAGAYGAAAPVDDEAKAVFEQAIGPQPEDRRYTPLTVSRQVVAGMNFRFTADEITPSGVSRVGIVIFRPLSGAPRVTSIEKLR
jgi:hypothetical protein